MSTKAATPIESPVDLSDPKYNPETYFGAQPQIAIFVKRDESDVLRDPDNMTEVIHKEGINGAILPIRMGHLNTVPLDYAMQMIDRRKAEPADHAQYEAAKAARTG